MQGAIAIEVPTKDFSVVKELRVGDIVYLNGLLITMRDSAHLRYLRLLKEGGELPVSIEEWAVFHAGPVIRRCGDSWEVISIGPTTSARMDALIAELIEVARPALIIGKGGLGPRSRRAIKEFGGAYLELVGGTSPLITEAVEEVVDVYWLDLGIPEAMWVLRVKGLGPAIVTVDSRGAYLRDEVLERARKVAEELLKGA